MAKDTISIGFEDKIWKAADVLRGNLNAPEVLRNAALRNASLHKRASPYDDRSSETICSTEGAMGRT